MLRMAGMSSEGRSFGGGSGGGGCLSRRVGRGFGWTSSLLLLAALCTLRLCLWPDFGWPPALALHGRLGILILLLLFL